MGSDVITIISALATILGAVGGMSLILLPQLRKLERQITGTRDELKGDIADLRTELKAEIAEVRIELKAEIAEVRTELKAEIAEVRTELKAEIAEVRTELKADIAGVREEVTGVRDEQVATRVAMTDRVARVEGRVFGLPLPEAVADTT